MHLLAVVTALRFIFGAIELFFHVSCFFFLDVIIEVRMNFKGKKESTIHFVVQAKWFLYTFVWITVNFMMTVICVVKRYALCWRADVRFYKRNLICSIEEVASVLSRSNVEHIPWTQFQTAKSVMVRRASDSVSLFFFLSHSLYLSLIQWVSAALRYWYNLYKVLYVSTYTSFNSNNLFSEN